MTSGWRSTSAATPSAMRRPKFSTVMLIGDFGHQRHVVVDDENGQALGGDALEQVAQALLFRRVEPRGRLVEQQQRRIAGKRARDLDQALMPVGKAR